MDLISRQALCEYALNQKDKSVTPNDIMRFPSAYPKWILCSERMPEENGQYLITVKYKHVNDGYEDVYAEHGEWYDGRWDMFCFGHCGEVEDIIAWLPLPEPYRREEWNDR